MKINISKKEWNQTVENGTASLILEIAMEEYKNEKFHSSKQLRNCQARVYETENFYILKSYDTFIAAIDKFHGTGADVLRQVYGYTATSAQHITKFFKDYALDMPEFKRFTYRDI